MSGRQSKVLAEQAARYNIPFGGATVDLPAVVRALHEFLAKHGPSIDVGGSAAPKDPALAALREEQLAMARIQRQRLAGELASIAHVRAGLTRGAVILRKSGETLARKFGPAAHGMLMQALDEWQREIDRMFAELVANEDAG